MAGLKLTAEIWRECGDDINRWVAHVMAGLAPMQRMLFAGANDPTAFLELRSIGIPDSKRNSLSAALTDLVAQSCEIKPDRIFIVLADVQSRFWGQSGAMLG